MKKVKLIVKTKSKSYPIYFGNNIVSSTGMLIKKKFTYLGLKRFVSLLTLIYLH